MTETAPVGDPNVLDGDATRRTLRQRQAEIETARRTRERRHDRNRRAPRTCTGNDGRVAVRQA